MTTAQLEHLRKIDAHLDALLALAAKRTPGEWGGLLNRVHNTENETVCFASSISPGEPLNAAFIASCAGNAEAGWKATRAAIKAILAADAEPLSDPDDIRIEFVNSIIAAFPHELIES